MPQSKAHAPQLLNLCSGAPRTAKKKKKKILRAVMTREVLYDTQGFSVLRAKVLQVKHNSEHNYVLLQLVCTPNPETEWSQSSSFTVN